MLQLWWKFQGKRVAELWCRHVVLAVVEFAFRLALGYLDLKRLQILVLISGLIFVGCMFYSLISFWFLERYSFFGLVGNPSESLPGVNKVCIHVMNWELIGIGIDWRCGWAHPWTGSGEVKCPLMIYLVICLWQQRLRRGDMGNKIQSWRLDWGLGFQEWRLKSETHLWTSLAYLLLLRLRQ